MTKFSMSDLFFTILISLNLMGQPTRLEKLSEIASQQWYSAFTLAKTLHNAQPSIAIQMLLKIKVFIPSNT